MIWEDIQSGLLHWIWSDAGAGLVLFAFLGFLVCVTLVLRRGTEHFEEVLSKGKRQLVFVLALLISAIFITPHLEIDQKEHPEVKATATSRQ